MDRRTDTQIRRSVDRFPWPAPRKAAKQPYGRDFPKKNGVLANQRREGWHRLQAALHVLRSDCLRDAAAEDEQNAGETRAIGDARPSAFRPRWWSWQERFDKIPQRIGRQRRSHTRPRYFADEDQVSAVLFHALNLDACWRS